MSTQYVSSVGYAAVAAWAASHTYAAGSIVRQLAAPALGNERCFRTANGGTTTTGEPAWVLTAGSSSPGDGTVLDWVECTGIQARQASNAWNAPHATLGAALASGWAAAGDNIYVSHDHAESQSVLHNLIWPGTLLLPSRCYCVNRGVGSSIPPQAVDLRTTATITCTAAGDAKFNNGGNSYCYGITFVCTNNFGNLCPNTGAINTGSHTTYDQCGFSLTAGGGSSNSIKVAKQLVTEWSFCTVTFAAIGQLFFTETGDFSWRGGTLSGVNPTALFLPGGNGGARSRIEGVDLSLLGSGGAIASIANEVSSDITILNCKMGAGFIGTTAAIPNIGGPNITIDNCDATGTTYRTERYRYQGSVKSNASVVKLGGATDGTTQISHAYATLASTQASFSQPLAGPTMFYWRDDINPHTVAVDILNDGATLNNDDIWIDVEYLGSSLNPQGSFVSTNKATPLSTNAALSTSTASWTSPGVTTPIAQKIVTPSFSPGLKGLFQVRCRMAKQNATIYVDPLLQIT